MNFRSGLFKGTHQDGIFGSYDKAVKWNNATWNSGFFVNSNWIKGSMNSKSVKGTKNFEEERNRLIAYIQKTQSLGADYFDGKISHSFGSLNKSEWNNLFYKHLDHHLTQFGV
jgi:hypothetical protein